MTGTENVTQQQLQKKLKKQCTEDILSLQLLAGIIRLVMADEQKAGACMNILAGEKAEFHIVTSNFTTGQPRDVAIETALFFSVITNGQG